MEKGIRDWLLFLAFSGVPISSFLLQDYPDTMFFGLLLVIFLIVLLWLRTYYKENNQLVDYDENLTLEGLGWIAGGIVATYIVASVIVSTFATSSIYIPYRGLEVTYLNFQISGVWNDILFTIVLVAPAEELCKLVLMLACFMKLRASLSLLPSQLISVGLPISVWAVLHAYSAYTGPNMPTMLLSAFIGGCLIFAVMWKTKSVMAAIFTHAGYNTVVLLVREGLLMLGVM